MDILHEFADPERVSKRLEFHRGVIAEEKAAAEICERVFTGPSRWWSNALRQVDGSRTAGMVAILMQRAEGTFHRSPLEALALSEMAVDIATAIQIEDYPYDHVLKIRGQALRLHAFALSYVGRLPEAAPEAELAGYFLAQIPVPSPEVARLDLVRSNIARNMEKYDEAIAHARRAAEVYLRIGDREAWIKALDFEACAYFSSRDFRRALEIWQEVGRHDRLLTDAQRVSHRYNLALCATEAGDFDEAMRSYTLAAEAAERLGLADFQAKCRHGVALALQSAGRHEEAIPLLSVAWKNLETLGMEGDATLAALALAESLFLAGRGDEVPPICRELIDRSTRAGMTGSAMTALAFLREALATGHATANLVRHIHDFLRDVSVASPRPFVPLRKELFAESITKQPGMDA